MEISPIDLLKNILLIFFLRENLIHMGTYSIFLNYHHKNSLLGLVDVYSLYKIYFFLLKIDIN